MAKLENPILMAKIGAAQGLRGEVRVSSYTDDPMALGDYGNLVAADGRVFEILEVRQGKNVVIVRFRGINDRNAAEALNGLELFVDRDNLPDEDLDEDEFFYTDLEGLDVVDAEGKSYGSVSAVYDFGAGDLLELKGAGRRPALIPLHRGCRSRNRSGRWKDPDRSLCRRTDRQSGRWQGRSRASDFRQGQEVSR